MDWTTVTTAAFLIGWLLDLCFGDPEKLPHPVIYMGKWISFFEKRLNKANNRKIKGALFACGSLVLLFASAYVLMKLPVMLLTVNIIAKSVCFVLTTVTVFFCLAGHTLRKEVRMVFEALTVSLDNGRKQVARIVGRDTAQLSVHEVQTASLETLAENLSDGVIAPLFWFCLLGVPGMLAYKMINTMDSMLGYKNERYKDFGCWAAHIDDIANFIPARLTAFLMIVAGSFSKGCKRSFGELCRFLCKFGNKHASPNSGWPEAALAGVLDCQFGGPHDYFGETVYKPFIGDRQRELGLQDLKNSLKICFSVEIFSVLLIVVLRQFYG